MISNDLLIFVFADQICVTKLLKVPIIVPVLKVVALSLKAGDFIQDAQIGGWILWAELTWNFIEQLELAFCQVPIVLEDSDVRNHSVFLDTLVS